MGTVECHELADHCNRLLEIERFEDYAPNGLQVEGEKTIARLVSGVTASAALIVAAREFDADALLVHHGWFWRGESPTLTGIKGRRARLLITSGMSLLAYHLPLDAHSELGNNAVLGRMLGAVESAPSGANGLLWRGRLTSALSAEQLQALIAKRLNRAPVHIGTEPRRIQRLAWCSGGGQGYIEQAADLGADAFISGELSEQTTHQARELGIHYFAAGHHATERGGAQALGEYLAAHFGFEHRFIDIDNPA